MFVVGCLGDWRSAGKVLFKPESLSGDPAPSRSKGQRVAPTVTTGPPYARTGNDRVETETYVTYRKVFHGEYTKDQGASTMLARDYKDATDLITFSPQNRHAVAYKDYLRFFDTTREMKVRRLTPRECERLQGFPDDWTRIQWKGKKPEECPDGHRYKAIGNSMAVPVMRWIGQQINQVEEE